MDNPKDYMSTNYVEARIKRMTSDERQAQVKKGECICGADLIWVYDRKDKPRWALRCNRCWSKWDEKEAK